MKVKALLIAVALAATAPVSASPPPDNPERRFCFEDKLDYAMIKDDASPFGFRYSTMLVVLENKYSAATAVLSAPDPGVPPDVGWTCSSDIIYSQSDFNLNLNSSCQAAVMWMDPDVGISASEKYALVEESDQRFGPRCSHESAGLPSASTSVVVSDAPLQANVAPRPVWRC